MLEHKFLKELQKRASEQKRLHSSIPFPSFFSFIAQLLGDHPWRVLIPISLLISFFLYFLKGNEFIEFVLWLFKVI